jgi:hypothetical protein
VVIASVVVPQAVAYAQIAGLPPQAGLMAAPGAMIALHPSRVIRAHPCSHDDERPKVGDPVEEYEIRVRGRVTPALLARFEGLHARVEPVETVLHGPVEDQAALHGMIHLVNALGLELLEVRRLPGDHPGQP